jgi:hypothetical protein
MNKYLLILVFFSSTACPCLSNTSLELVRSEKEHTNGLDDIVRIQTTKILRGDERIYMRSVHFADTPDEVESITEWVFINGTPIYTRSVRDGVVYLNVESISNYIISQEDLDKNHVPKNLVIWSKKDGLIESFERTSSGYLEPVGGKKLIEYRKQWGDMASWIPYMKDEPEAEQ